MSYDLHMHGASETTRQLNTTTSTSGLDEKSAPLDLEPEDASIDLGRVGTNETAYSQRAKTRASSQRRLKILFFCTAHNSLSQQLYLQLSVIHDITIEYALSGDLMISAAELFHPHLIIGTFLTAKVPARVYEKYMTLIVHPGPPGDAGPSAIDWVLMGDDGSIDDPEQLRQYLDTGCNPDSRCSWGVSIIQATEEFDAGPIWAFDQFPININLGAVNKSDLYRGSITRAAIRAITVAVDRIIDAAGQVSAIQIASQGQTLHPQTNLAVINGQILEDNRIESDAWSVHVSPALSPKSTYGTFDIRAHKPFLGGKTHHRPLLKPGQRTFDVSRHSANEISRRLRSADSQPGVLSNLFGPGLYLYGGIVEDLPNQKDETYPEFSNSLPRPTPLTLKFGDVFGIRHGAICIAAADGNGIWITHLRRPKRKTDSALWPKLPAIKVLVQLGLIQPSIVSQLDWPISYKPAVHSTFQEISIKREVYSSGAVAFIEFKFYNGAQTTEQCQCLLDALHHVLTGHKQSPISAVVLQGGSYFSNGIALNTIEAAANPSDEAWANINAMNDVVFCILHSCATANPPIRTIAAMRGNGAAGGMALAAACDIVMAGEYVVLNPAYRASGLYGSEYHTITYPGRCGSQASYELLHRMLPLSPNQALEIGLVDVVLPGWGNKLDGQIAKTVESVIAGTTKFRDWKAAEDLSQVRLSNARAMELGEMSKDFWSARNERFHKTRSRFVRKIVPAETPLRFAVHRRIGNQQNLEESDTWDDVSWWEEKAKALAKAEALNQIQQEYRKVLGEQRVTAKHTVPPNDEGTEIFFSSAITKLDRGIKSESNRRRSQILTDSDISVAAVGYYGRLPGEGSPVTMQDVSTSKLVVDQEPTISPVNPPSASKSSAGIKNPSTLSAELSLKNIGERVNSGDKNKLELAKVTEMLGLSQVDTLRLEEAGVDAENLFGCYYDLKECE